jgi:hypothetical protein
MKATDIVKHLVDAIAKRGDHEVYMGNLIVHSIETYDAGTVEKEIPVTVVNHAGS